MSTRREADLIGTLVILKGYSAMLAPAERVDNLLVWYLCRSSTKDPISYIDHGISHPYKLDVDDLMKCRHIVGWCSNIRNHCGAVDGFPVGLKNIQ